jgi:hypothetical protein
VNCLISELNSLFNQGLGIDPILDRFCNEESTVRKVLMIGGSHARREAEVFAETGYEVVTCAVGGWRPNKTAIDDMTEKVSEAITAQSDDDIMVIHCFDNIAYMARYEEGEGPPHPQVPHGGIPHRGRARVGQQGADFYIF